MTAPLTDIYRQWSASGGAGSRLNPLDCIPLPDGGMCSSGRGPRQGVAQFPLDDSTIGRYVHDGRVSFPLATWNVMWANAATVEVLHVTKGVCLRMYLQHCVETGSVQGDHVVVPVSAWTIYTPGGHIVQPGHLGSVLPAPAVAVVMVDKQVPIEETQLPVAAPDTVDLHAWMATRQSLIVLHPKAWSDSYLLQIQDALVAVIGRPVVALARDLWEAHAAAGHGYATWPHAILTGFDTYVLPIQSATESRTGAATIAILEALRAAARPILVWNVRDKTCHAVTGWARMSKDMATGWEIRFTGSP